MKFYDDQNHIESDRLTASLLMACHHPGGKNKRSPGPMTVVMACGTTSS
jgi:hypothetical protein